MALAVPLRKLFTSAVTLASLSSIDKWGKSSFGSAVSYRAKIERASELVMTNSGDEVTGRYKVFIDTTTIPSVSDQITLPSGYEPTTPKILQVRPVSDHRGVNHVVVMI